MSALPVRKEHSSARHGGVHPGTPTVAFAVAVTTLLIALPVAAHEECPNSLNQMAAVIGVQADVFAALENEDQSTWQRLTTRDFVGFEGGRRYDRTALFDAIKYAHGAGQHFSWSVTSPRLEAACTVATLIYVNQGSITRGSSRSAVSWLETATFKYAEGHWRVVFMESMRESPAD
jgi:hypothetical protein